MKLCLIPLGRAGDVGELGKFSSLAHTPGSAEIGEMRNLAPFGKAYELGNVTSSEFIKRIYKAPLD